MAPAVTASSVILAEAGDSANRREDDQPIVSIRGLTKSYRGSLALADIDLDVRRGEFLTLLGPSGSGKTTLLGLIAGIVLPSGGAIELAGHDISRIPPEGRDIGVVFQSYALFPHLTVRDNIAFPLRFRALSSAERRQKVDEVLALVRLEDFTKRYPHELSGGQQQRVALARALVFRPAILLMDEPLSALDKKLRDHMKAELRQIQQSLGLTIIYVTHDQEEALSLSTRIALMQDGFIRQIGSPEEIYRHPRSRFVANFVGDANLIEAPIIRCEAAEIAVQFAGAVIAAPRLAARVSDDARMALFMVRPEHIVLGDIAGASENRVRGRVLSRMYEGAGDLYEIDVNGIAMRARVSGASHDRRVEPGEMVEIGWARRHTHFVEASGNEP